ncbi:TrbG/VirB9 family P-type conjugative transfer protein, partial [Vibrio tubiashii]
LTTNKGRTYTFDLMVDDYPHFMVKFRYPTPPKKKSEPVKPTVPCFDGTVNYQYEKWGDMEISPTYMWDDGRFTCLKFNEAFELPVIYQVLADGSESLIQYHMSKNTMVVHGVSKEFRLRLGELVLGLHTKRAQTTSHNDKKTSIEGQRVIKHE